MVKNIYGSKEQTKKKPKIFLKKKKKGGYTSTITQTTPTLSYTLRLRGSPQQTLFLFLQQNHQRIHQTNQQSVNTYLTELFQHISDLTSSPSSEDMKKLINLFTEPYVFMKNENELEPLSFSMLEIQLFGYKPLFPDEEIDESKEEKVERETIENEMLKYFQEGYDLELNPYFIRDLSIFEKLRSFMNSNRQNGGRMSIQRKAQMENIRQALNTAHNFLKSEADENNSEEEELTEANKKKKVRIPGLSKLILKSVDHNIASRSNIFPLSIGSLKRNLGLLESNLVKTTLCESMPPPRSFIPGFHSKEEKEKTKKVKKEINKNGIITIQEPFMSMSKVDVDTLFFTNYKTSKGRNKGKKAMANFENKFLRFLLVQNYIDENVFYLSYSYFITNPIYLTYFKEIMYNVLGRFQFIVNDASGFSVILSKLLDKKGYGVSQVKKKVIENKGETEAQLMENTFNSEADIMKNKVKLYYLMRTSVLQNTKLMIQTSNRKNLPNPPTIRVLDTWLKSEFKRIQNDIKAFIIQIKNNISSTSQLNEMNTLIEVFNNMKKRYEELVQSILYIQELQQIRQKINYEFNSTAPPSSSKNDYREFTYSSWGMESDPAPGKRYQVQLFSKSLYQKLYLDVFGDLQKKGIKFEFIFKSEKQNSLQPSLSNVNLENMNSQKLSHIGFKIIHEGGMTQEELNTINPPITFIKGKPLFELKKDSSDSRPHFIVEIPIGKAMNKASLINDVIRELLEKYYGKMIKNRNPGMMNNMMMSQSMTNNPPKIDLNSIQFKKEGDKEYFQVYDQFIRILLKMGYNIYEITRFILRFKILGDKLQGLEAKYNCTLIKQFKSSEKDIYVKRRVLVTQDRPLNAYAQVEGDINFLSKATIEGIKLIYWNFGDADSRFDMSHLEESLSFVPITSMFTMGKSIVFNHTKLNTNVKEELNEMNQLESELKNKKNQLEGKTPLTHVVLPNKKTKKKPIPLSSP